MLQDILTDAFFGSSHPTKVPPMQRTPGYSYLCWPCTDPWDIPVCTHFNFSCLARVPSVQSPGIPRLIPTSALAILSRCTLYIELQDFLGCALFSFSCPARVPSVWRVQRLHQPLPTSASAVLPKCLLCIEPQNPLACTHFSFSCSARVSCGHRTLGPFGLHLLQLWPSDKDSPSTECPVIPSPHQPQLKSAS